MKCRTEFLNGFVVVEASSKNFVFIVTLPRCLSICFRLFMSPNYIASTISWKLPWADAIWSLRRAVSLGSPHIWHLFIFLAQYAKCNYNLGLGIDLPQLSHWTFGSSLPLVINVLSASWLPSPSVLNYEYLEVNWILCSLRIALISWLSFLSYYI